MLVDYTSCRYLDKRSHVKPHSLKLLIEVNGFILQLNAQCFELGKYCILACPSIADILTRSGNTLTRYP